MQRRKALPGGALCLVAAFLGGCSHSQGTAPGSHVFINLDYLVKIRPEWQGVEQINNRLAYLQNTERQMVPEPHAEPAPESTAVPVNLRPLTLPSVSRQDTRGLMEAVAASTPGAATIRNELETETAGAEMLYVRNAHAEYQSLVDAQQHRLGARYAMLAVQIRRDYETQVINLRLHIHLLNQRILSLKQQAITSTVPSTALKNLQEDLASTRASLTALNATLAERLRKNTARMQAELSTAESSLNAAMLSDIAAHDRERQSTISRQVAAARLDIDEEAQQRRTFYQSAVFASPLSGRVSMDHPTSPAPYLGAPTVNNVALGQAATRAQVASLVAQRTALEQLIVRDTRNWVDAVAARKHWNVSLSPGSSLPDATPQIAVWLRDATIPPASGH